jgi:hypothetical protein
VKKETKPKSVKVKKEPEFKRPHPGPVVVHVERPVIDDSSTERRSKRAKVAPVAFWKNEKVIYGRRESGIIPIFIIGIALQDVIRIPSDDESFSRPRKLKSKPREKVREDKVKKEKLEIPPPPSEIEVVNYATKQEEFQRDFLF